jgi:iron complex transport system substrate-binding protein
MNKIISLCPSTTLTLFDLGLEKQVIGRTIFCNKPEDKINRVMKFGGTKNPKIDKIRSFSPSHILFNEEENDITHLKVLQDISEIIIHTPTDIPSSIKMIRDYGQIFNCTESASLWAEKITKKYIELKNENHKTFTYLYLIWKNPYMLAGESTYINSMLSLINGKNLASQIPNARYPEISFEQINDLEADFIFLSTEPFPFTEKHIDDFKKINSTIKIVDGEALSWHGTYSYYGLDYLNKLAKNINLGS